MFEEVVSRQDFSVWSRRVYAIACIDELLQHDRQ